MKLGIVSDIHCNLAALTAAMAVLGDCDELVCARDLMLEYRWQPEILRLLRHRGARIISGNHDRSLCSSVDSGHIAAQAGIDELQSLPEHLELTLAGTRVAVYHGAPWDSHDCYYLFPGDQAGLRRAAETEADLLILGHTHVAMNVSVAGTTIVNPGSCGEPGRQQRVHTCASVELPSREVTFHVLV